MLGIACGVMWCKECPGGGLWAVQVLIDGGSLIIRTIKDYQGGNRGWF